MCRAPERGGPSSEECAREVLSRGKWVRETRSGWANGAQLAGPAPRPPWACSVCVSRLTGGNAYLRKARGQLCGSASLPRGPSVREKYSWQWEDSGEANRSTWASPNQLQISRIVSGWSCHSPGNVSCRESASAARLSFHGMWTARSDLNCLWLQRRR